MTKPRIDPAREIYGLLGRWPKRSALLQAWDAWFFENHIDAAMLHYPAAEETLPERFSEMFHFDRRAYLVDPALQAAVLPLLDAVTESAAREGRVDVILNASGVLTGHLLVPQGLPQADLWQVICRGGKRC